MTTPIPWLSVRRANRADLPSSPQQEQEAVTSFPCRASALDTEQAADPSFSAQSKQTALHVPCRDSVSMSEQEDIRAPIPQPAGPGSNLIPHQVSGSGVR